MTSREETSKQPDAMSNVEKMTEGHRRIAEARRINVEEARQAFEHASWVHQLLARDQEALQRYGYQLPQPLDRALSSLDVVVKTLDDMKDKVQMLLDNDAFSAAQARRD